MAGRTREELLQAYRALDETILLNQMVHDLRGPLTGIISATRLIDALLAEDTADIAKIAEVNGLVRDASDSLRAILDAVADYDREQRSGAELTG
jgi:signal transduction histidine kinase